MESDPRRRRFRPRRRGAGTGGDRAKPERPPAAPKGPLARGPLARPDRAGRPDRRARPEAAERARRERPRRRMPRRPDDLRPGTPCVIVMDCREGEPDRTGAAAVFEGFFDLETGEVRRSGGGVPRLRIVEPPGPREALAKADRLWGFECWWRPDPAGVGLTPTDHEEIEQSKKLLRGLLRDSRRAGRPLGLRT